LKLLLFFLYLSMVLTSILEARKTKKIVTTWAIQFKKILLDNFAKVGQSEAPIVKLSQSNFQIICTGRVNCVGLHATFQMKNRHDLLSLVLDLFSPKTDRLTLDFALESDVQMMVFGIFPMKYERTLKDDERFKDIIEFAKKRKTPAFPPNFTVYSDTTEIVDLLLTAGLAEIVNSTGHLLEFIQITDQCPTSIKFKKILRVQMNLPDIDKMAELSDLILFSIYLVDVIAQANLSQTSQQKAKSVREIFVKSQKKEEEKESLNKIEEAKRKKEEEEYEKLTPDQKKKEEEKRKKKEIKKKNKVMVKRVKV